jgi:uncharacterized protein YacL
MNKMYYNTIMMSTIFFMVFGFLLSLWGLHTDAHNIVYVGVSIMAGVCAVWWFWVMFVIKDMFDRVEKAADKMVEVKEELGGIRGLIAKLFSTQEDK